ncbi:MAG TPA: valine dehydrogenase, partial [Actinobacteria bacterium]|nr:valine dehydrogenase [Actinomycetota bacterium]
MGFDGHESVVVAQDESTGLQAIVAIHSTVLGPALGGVRMSTYADTSSGAHAAAYADALRLSRAMTYKNALAGLPHGGGKAVIVHDPSNKPPE